MNLQSNKAKLIVLTFTHFIVDFYGGLTVPLAEPTLTMHLGVSLLQPLQQLLQGHAMNLFHGEVDRTVRLDAQFMHGDDIGVFQLCHDPCFPNESSALILLSARQAF